MPLYNPDTAIGTVFTPTGSIAGTNVQTAVAEVDSEKLALTGGTMTAGLIINPSVLTPVPLSPDALLTIMQSDGVQPRMLLDGYGGSGVGQGNFIFRKARITAGNRSAVQSGDLVGQFSWFGYGTTGYSSGAVAQVRAVANQNYTDTAFGTYLALTTTPDGGTTTLVRGGFDAAGTFFVGTGPTGTGIVDQNRLIFLRQYTVATLPTVGTAGRLAAVTDALAPTYNATVAGGGAVNVPVYDNQTAWVCH